MSMFFVFVYQCIVVFLAYEYVCCLFCLPVMFFVFFVYQYNYFTIPERESHHVMVVPENETWIWRGRIVTMPLPSGF